MTTSFDSLDTFYEQLAKRKNSLTVFNPYREAHKLNNLKAYIEAMKALNPDVLLVGEALGFKGGRHTGIPFSSARLYQEVAHPFLVSLSSHLSVFEDDAENTASIVWNALKAKQCVPVFWNAYPFHPHPSRIQKKNRAPNKIELTEGMFYLKAMNDFFKPSVIAGLGRKGVEAAKVAFPEKDILYIRHPSYGGKADFLKGIDAVLK